MTSYVQKSSVSGVSTEALITIDNVGKIYKTGDFVVHALTGITLDIPVAAFLSIVGPSGSGKTTLLNLIGCLDTPSEGVISIAGKDVTRLNATQRARFRGEHIGFIFQDFNLIPVLTVYENVEYPLLMVRSLPKRERRERVLSLLESTGMSDQKDKFPSQLSGGQKQRVAIARALTTSPRLVLADEPTANLDHDTAYMVIGLMKSLRDRQKISFIFSTHDTKIIGEVESVISLEDGRIVAHATSRGSNHE